MEDLGSIDEKFGFQTKLICILKGDGLGVT